METIVVREVVGFESECLSSMRGPENHFGCAMARLFGSVSGRLGLTSFHFSFLSFGGAVSTGIVADGISRDSCRRLYRDRPREGDEAATTQELARGLDKYPGR